MKERKLSVRKAGIYIKMVKAIFRMCERQHIPLYSSIPRRIPRYGIIYPFLL